MESIEITGAEAKAAFGRIKAWLDHPDSFNDADGYLIIAHPAIESAHAFIRNNLDLHGDGLDAPDDDYPELTRIMRAGILTDLSTIWDYGYYRDELSELAMRMSLCPMHFVDWAICFDDEVNECSQIRAIFPHGHDT